MLVPPRFVLEPAAADEKPKLRFAEDIMAPRPAKSGTKAGKGKKKKKATHGKESAEDGIKLRKGRRDAGFTTTEEEEYY